MRGLLKAEVGERFAAFEVGQVGCRGAVDVQDVEDVVGGQGVVAELCGGFEHVHPALQPGEGRDTVGSEGDDLAVKNRFAVVEHLVECVDDLGKRGAEVVAVARPECRRFGAGGGDGSDAVPFRLEGPALPCWWMPKCGEHRRHWLSGGCAHAFYCARVCTGFGGFSEVETIAR